MICFIIKHFSHKLYGIELGVKYQGCGIGICIGINLPGIGMGIDIKIFKNWGIGISIGIDLSGIDIERYRYRLVLHISSTYTLLYSAKTGSLKLGSLPICH